MPADAHGRNHGVGSMIYQTASGAGWGENYVSEAYRNLIDQHPTDVRRQFIEPQYERDENGDIIMENGETVLSTRKGFPRYYMYKFNYLEGIVTCKPTVLIR